MKPRSVLLISLLVLGIVGGFGWYFSYAPAAGPPSRAAAPPAVPVVSGIARRQSVPIYLTGVGSAQAFNTVTVRVRVDGQLETLAFAEGQYVKRGDLLAQIDPRPFQAQLAQAQAAKLRDEVQLANAQRDLERLTSLAARDFATKQGLERQQALVAQLSAAVQGDQALIDQAKVQLDYTTIRSPIDGYTGLRLVDQGNIVHANDANGLVVITQRQPINAGLLRNALSPATASYAWPGGPKRAMPATELLRTAGRRADAFCTNSRLRKSDYSSDD